MKRLLVVFVVLLTFQAVALASPKNIDLREYQQATGTINVLAAPFENDNFYLATFNFDEQNKGDKVNFYQGTCIIDKENQKVLMCVLPTKDYYKLKEGIHEIDPKSFFVVTDAYEVFGGE